MCRARGKITCFHAQLDDMRPGAPFPVVFQVITIDR